MTFVKYLEPFKKCFDRESVRKMKKTYVAPAIAIERYELTQAIASCGTKIGAYDSECVINDSDSTEHMKYLAYSEYFIDDICTQSAKGMDDKDSICYHTNANAAFTS